MKITRRQLRQIIKEETQMNEVMWAVPAGLGLLLANFILYGNALTAAAEKVWDDPAFAETRVLLEAMREAAKKLPASAKKGAVDFIVATVDNSLESSNLMLNARSKEPEEAI